MSQQKLALIVDDFPHWRDRMSKAVEACGFRSIRASGFFEAIRLLPNQTFDLIVTDNNMPRRDEGVELLQYVNRIGMRVPTVLFTTMPSSELISDVETAFPWARVVEKDEIVEDTLLISAIRELFP